MLFSLKKLRTQNIPRLLLSEMDVVLSPHPSYVATAAALITEKTRLKKNWMERKLEGRKLASSFA